MKLRLLSITIYIFSVNAWSAVMSDVKTKLKFHEAQFESVKGEDPSCSNVIIPLQYEGDDNNVILRLGEHFIFPHLEITAFTEPGEKGCIASTKTDAEAQKVSQVTTMKCKNKKKNYVKNQSLKLEGDALLYNYEIKGEPKSKIACEFKMVSENSTEKK